MGCAFALHGQSFQKLWSQTIKHFFNISSFFYSKRNDVAPSQSLTTNLTQPKLTFPPTNKLCPQLNLNHLPQGCQPCMLPLRHTLPPEKTTILAYKYQRYSFQNWNLCMYQSCIFFCMSILTLLLLPNRLNCCSSSFPAFPKSDKAFVVFYLNSKQATAQIFNCVCQTKSIQST